MSALGVGIQSSVTSNPCGVPPALLVTVPVSAAQTQQSLMSCLRMATGMLCSGDSSGTNTVLFSRKSFQQIPQVYSIFITSPFMCLLSRQLCGREFISLHIQSPTCTAVLQAYPKSSVSPTQKSQIHKTVFSGSRHPSSGFPCPLFCPHL